MGVEIPTWASAIKVQTSTTIFAFEQGGDIVATTSELTSAMVINPGTKVVELDQWLILNSLAKIESVAGTYTEGDHLHVATN